MASVNSRLTRLEGRIEPKHEPDPESAATMSLLLKSMNHARAEADAEERGDPPPPPPLLTPEEEEAERRATREFLPYLESQRERAGPGSWEDLDRAIAETKAEIAKLDAEEERG